MSCNLKEILNSTKAYKVLLVEDNQDLREYFEMIFEEFFEKIDLAKDGIEGLEMFMNQLKKYDLIITDVNMPRVNGIDMCKAIKMINPEQKFILLTGDNTSDCSQRIKELNLHNFVLSKPFSLKQLSSCLSQWIL